ncbi:hypothetical protein IscW_ISCW021447 [Ixodes scapularis]|uniref:Uncharacterized protein n=1 Tax=Ixodes scapularis TaxID=6945 RepID=B7Q5X4_IXOSC|nr:hypothetical protein IscW_ISCW021447 [Ixodes scapularis]|eukprot:XP_002411829.1 hypothetical protein IscW_ISCW021447 [Ixodes scapularis]
MAEAQNDIVLLERVFLRIVTAETDEQFESILGKFLLPILLKLSSTQEGVRKKLALAAIPHVTLPSSPEARASWLGLPEGSDTLALLRERLLDLLLLPYSGADPSMTGGTAPACLSNQSLARLLPEGPPTPEELEKAKLGALTFVASGVFPERSIVVHLLMAAADSRHSEAVGVMQVREEAARTLGLLCLGQNHFPHARAVLNSLVESSMESPDMEVHFTVGEAICCALLGPTSPLSRDAWATEEEDFVVLRYLRSCLRSGAGLPPADSETDLGREGAPKVLRYLRALLAGSSPLPGHYARLLVGFLPTAPDVSPLCALLELVAAEPKEFAPLLDNQKTALKNLLSSSKEQVRECAAQLVGFLVASRSGEAFLGDVEALCGDARSERAPNVQSPDMEVHFTVGEAICCALLGPTSPLSRDAWATEEEDFVVMEASKLPLGAGLLSCCIALGEVGCVATPPFPVGDSEADTPPEDPGLTLLALVRALGTVLHNAKAPAKVYMTQSIASKGLSLLYELSDEESRGELVSLLLETLTSGRRSTVAVTQDTRLFDEGTLGSAPTGGGLTTYRELCSLATDLNQPDLMYKTGREQLSERLGDIVPKLYRYRYDPNPGCVQFVDASVLTALVPRLVEQAKSSVGLGTRAGCAHLAVALTHQCPLELQPHAGKLLRAFVHGLSDRNATVRRCCATAVGNLAKVAKESDVDRLMAKLRSWYMETDDEAVQWACAHTMQSVARHAPDILRAHATAALPLAFFAKHAKPLGKPWVLSWTGPGPSCCSPALLARLSGRTWAGKVSEALIRECRKENPTYKEQAVSSLAQLVEKHELDYFAPLLEILEPQLRKVRGIMAWQITRQKSSSWHDEASGPVAISSELEQDAESLLLDSRLSGKAGRHGLVAIASCPLEMPIDWMREALRDDADRPLLVTVETVPENG